MEENRIRLITSVLHFLRSEHRTGQLTAENKEGIELAIQCLELVYNIKETVQAEPDLLEIYNNYLLATIKQKPDVSEEDNIEAQKLKNEGNKAMTQGQFSKALDFYTKAIQIDPKNAVYYCNRAAAYSKVDNHIAAIADCNVAIEIDPNYSKAYGRLGLAYYGLGVFDKAVDYYKKAIELDPSNEAFKNNYEQTLTKLKKSTNEASTSTGLSDTTGEPFIRNLNTLLGNPHLMNVASQVFSNPSMQNLMMNVLATRLGQNRPCDIEDFQNIGESLAQEMFNENPQTLAELIDVVSQTTSAEEGTSSHHQPSNSVGTEENQSDSIQMPPTVHDDQDQEDTTNK